jgi:hypothetical protein
LCSWYCPRFAISVRLNSISTQPSAVASVGSRSSLKLRGPLYWDRRRPSPSATSFSQIRVKSSTLPFFRSPLPLLLFTYSSISRLS